MAPDPGTPALTRGHHEARLGRLGAAVARSKHAHDDTLRARAEASWDAQAFGLSLGEIAAAVGLSRFRIQEIVTAEALARQDDRPKAKESPNG